MFSSVTVFAAIFSFIALSKAKVEERLQLKNPRVYLGIGNIKTARVLAHIGLVLSAVALLIVILYFSIIASGGLEDKTSF